MSQKPDNQTSFLLPPSPDPRLGEDKADRSFLDMPSDADDQPVPTATIIEPLSSKPDELNPVHFTAVNRPLPDTPVARAIRQFHEEGLTRTGRGGVGISGGVADPQETESLLQQLIELVEKENEADAATRSTDGFGLGDRGSTHSSSSDTESFLQSARSVREGLQRRARGEPLSEKEAESFLAGIGFLEGKILRTDRFSMHSSTYDDAATHAPVINAPGNPSGSAGFEAYWEQDSGTDQIDPGDTQGTGARSHKTPTMVTTITAGSTLPSGAGSRFLASMRSGITGVVPASQRTGGASTQTRNKDKTSGSRR